MQRPDGDVEVEIDEGFIVPPCPSCSGLLKPDVIFFGDNVPRQRVEAANSLIKSSDGILVIGSSLMVFSAYRLCKLAEEHGIPVAVLNMGETRIDKFENLIKYEAPAGATMSQILKCISI